MSRWSGVGLTLATLLAFASIVSLISYGFQIGWVAPLKLAIEFYQAMMRVLFGWAEPYLMVPITYINELVGWHLRLSPLWKYFFVVLWVYLGALSRAFSFGGPGWHKAAVITLRFTFSFVSALLAGLVPADTASKDWDALAFTTILPVAVVFFLSVVIWSRYIAKIDWSDLIEILDEIANVYNRKQPSQKKPRPLEPSRLIRYYALGMFFIFYFSVALTEGLLVWLSKQMPILAELQNRAAVFFGAALTILALLSITTSALFTLLDGMSGWRMRFLQSPYARAGTQMLSAIGGAILLVLGNAGMKLLGL